MQEVDPRSIGFVIHGIALEKNEDGEFAVFMYLSIDGIGPNRCPIYPNEEQAAGSLTPWELSQAVNHLKESYGCKD